MSTHRPQPETPGAAPSLAYLFPILVLVNFAAALSARPLDPVLPQIGRELLVSTQLVATLAAAGAASFALVQLPLGAVADFFGKPRLIFAGLTLLTVVSFAGAVTDSFEFLMLTRIVGGMAAGATFPVTMALTSDLFAVEHRRVAISRLMLGGQFGNLIGAGLAGVLGDIVGWRGVLITLGFAILLSTCAVGWGFRHQMRAQRKAIDYAQITANYKIILKHRDARVCYFGVFSEGVLVFGMFPFVAAFFVAMGEPRASIAGLVIGGQAIGGLVYALTVKRMLPLFGESGLMKLGAVLMGTQIMVIGFGPPWPLQFLSFVAMGCGFYMLHGGFLLFNSEVVPHARGNVLSLQAFSFSVGQFVGPLLYGEVLSHVAKLPALIAFGALMIAVGLGCCVLLTRKSPAA